MLTVPVLKSFDERIKEVRIGSCRLLMLPSEVENVVSWQGSFLTNPKFADREELVQSFLVSLLDKGTRTRDKFKIAEVLENKGAEIHFRQRGMRVGFSGQALRDDFSEVFGILVEQLLSPRMAEDEFVKARMRIAASIQRNMEQTSSRAGMALRQLIYPQSHPNYSFSAENELKTLGEIEISRLQQYHNDHFGADDCILVVVGDIDMDVIARTVEQHLAGWKEHNIAPVFESVRTQTSPQKIHVPMSDKFNLDVKMGHHVNLHRRDKDFTSLHIGNYILGGNFSSRLMDVIRDEMGLTYGVHSGLPGVSKEYNGHWQISITLSQDKLEEGIAATHALIFDFVKYGVTAEEVEEKKETITGTYKVQMGTTHGLASLILRSLEHGFEKNRLDTFSIEVASTTVEDVNSALRKYLDPALLHIASAGTLPA